MIGEFLTMAKAYWIAHVTVTDMDEYQKYVASAPPAFEKYGAKILVRGGSYEVMEGSGRARNVVIEFASYEDALACYHSEEYQKARMYRKDAGVADITIVEGI